MRVAPMTSRFLDACKRRPTDVRPIWFMRQAGRYLRQYREIRSKHGILEICKRPDLAATVTLQPVEILDVDAAIIFADLLLPVEPMGLKLRFATGEGPRIDNPVHTNADVDSLSTANTDDLGYVGEAIQNVVRALAGKVPVIGFVGAPFTLASYMIEGGASRNYIRTKRMMYSDEILWRRLMGKIVDVQAAFASLQVSAGARCIQAFDSWVGAAGTAGAPAPPGPRWPGGPRRPLHTGLRQLGGRAGTRRLRALRAALFARAHRAHPRHRRAGDPLRHGRLGLLPRAACGRRRRDGGGLARQYRPGLDGHQLSLGSARQPGSGSPVRAAAGAEDEDRRAAEAHRHTARTHFQRGSRHPAGDSGGECEGLRGDGPRVQAVGESDLRACLVAPGPGLAVNAEVQRQRNGSIET